MSKTIKKKQLSPVAQAITNVKSDDEKSFEWVKTLTFTALRMKQFKSDTKLLTYQRLVLATMRQKDSYDREKYIENNLKAYRAMFEKFTSEITSSDLTWLTTAKVDIQNGKSGNAILPLSSVYEAALKMNDDMIDTIEGILFHIFKFLSRKDSEERKKLDAICVDFELEKPAEVDASTQALKNMTTKIQSQLGGSNNNGAPSEEQIMGIIKGIAGGATENGGGGGIGDLVNGLMTGKLSIPDMVKSITETVEENNKSIPSNSSNDNNRISDKGKDESN